MIHWMQETDFSRKKLVAIGPTEKVSYAPGVQYHWPVIHCN